MTNPNKIDIVNLANILSILRIISVPIVLILLLKPQKIANLIAAVIFIFASITDWLDGYIARKKRVVTSIGTFLDPLADKLLVVVSLIMLIQLNRVEAWITAIIVGRELSVTGLRIVAISRGLAIETSSLAKYKTTFQMVAIVGLIIYYPYFSINFQMIGSIFLWIALFITVWTGVDYFIKYSRMISAG